MYKIKKLPDFINDNLIEFNDFNNEIDAKLTSLRFGLKSYYETYNIWPKGYYEYFQKGTTYVALSNVKGSEYLIRYFASITFVHLFFEQLIHEILENISPILSKLTLEKNSDFIEILTEDIFNKDVSTYNNIDFSIALSRVKELIKNDERIPARFKIDTKYHFLLNHIETIEQLSKLRNDIIHSGKVIINRYVYEYLFVNKILPLIREYLNTKKRLLFLERDLHCKKNVINEIIKNPLPTSFSDLKKYDNLCRELRRINHFKELGRASYSNPLNMLEDITSLENRKYFEETYNKTQREKASLHVQFKQEILGHYDVHICPCCGTKTLTTFDFWTVLINQRIQIQSAECSVCSYKVEIEIGEPKEFGLMDTELFKFIN